MIYIAALPVGWLVNYDLEGIWKEAVLAVPACVRRYKGRERKTSVRMACIPAEILTAYLKNNSVDFLLQQPDVSKDIITKWRVKWSVRPVLIYTRANILISRTCFSFSLFWNVYHGITMNFNIKYWLLLHSRKTSTRKLSTAEHPTVSCESQKENVVIQLQTSFMCNTQYFFKTSLPTNALFIKT
jgi:hypothetical protein